MRTKTAVLGIEYTCYKAAEYGDLECLKYAHETAVLGMKRLVLMLPLMVTSSV